MTSQWVQGHTDSTNERLINTGWSFLGILKKLNFYSFCDHFYSDLTLLSFALEASRPVFMQLLQREEEHDKQDQIAQTGDELLPWQPPLLNVAHAGESDLARLW